MNALAKFGLKTKMPSKDKKDFTIVIPKQAVSDPIINIKAVTNVLPENELKEAVPRIKITDKTDAGKQAAEIRERLKNRTNATIISKFPIKVNTEVVVVEEEVNKAPIIEFEPVKKPKKLKKPMLVIEGDVDVPLPLVEEVLKNPVDRDTLEFKDAYKRAETNKSEAIREANIEVVTNFTNKTPVSKTYKNMTPLIQMTRIGDTSLNKRLPVTPPYTLQVSEHYMNNREKFVDFINNVFDPYKQDLQDETKNMSCDTIGKDTGKIGLLTHQKIVREYMNLYTPYRGLLLYHGLGSGKTCSSIAIAEGLKSYRRIIIMTPASLRRNYIEEIKKCGDLLYRKNQFWEWMSTDSNQEIIEPLSAALGLPIEYIKTHRGAWLVNVRKPTNYASLSTTDKKSLNNQLDEMINYKYWFINYNGLRREKFNVMTNNLETNIFDNSVVIIDEAHNLISRIVNKINKASKFAEAKKGPGALMHSDLSLQIYEFLLRAEGCRIVLLTGTPIINYPNEIGILFNILRGYIKTWTFNLKTIDKTITKDRVLDWFSKEKVLDYVDYKSGTNTLTITRNPYGFQNKITKSSGYKGIKYDNHDLDEHGIFRRTEEGIISDEAFIKRTMAVLKDQGVDVVSKDINFTINTALPDTMDSFVNNFIDKESGAVHNIEKFKRRIIGLTSYFRSAQEELLPRYNKDTDRHVVLIPMSNYQFQIYENARHEERQHEKPSKKGPAKVDKDGMFIQPVSTYKIFSRLFCNFVMPNPPGRPTPAGIRNEGNADAITTLLERRANERTMDTYENTNIYLDSFSDEYKANDENMRKINETIAFYKYVCLKVQKDVIPVEDFLTEDYQHKLKTDKLGTFQKYNALTIEEKAALDVEFNSTIAEAIETKKVLDANDAKRATNKDVKENVKEDVKEAVKEDVKEDVKNVVKNVVKVSKGELKARENLAKDAEKIMAADAKAATKREKDDIKEAERLKKEILADQKALTKVEALAKAKADKDETKREKDLAKAEEAETKREKDLAKVEAKKDKDDAKAEAILLAKKEKEDAKVEAKRMKDLAKKEKGKGFLFDDEGYETSDTDYSSESDYSSDYSDTGSSDYSDTGSSDYSDYSDTKGTKYNHYGGTKDNVFQQWIDKDESDDEFSVASIPGLHDEDAVLREKDELEGDELLEKLGGDPYKKAINDSLAYLKANKERLLNLDMLKILSPKFLAMVESIQSREHPGLHLVYSQFRSMEGIGIFALTLEANGFARFKIRRSDSESWEMDMSASDLGKPTYALYTGTEDSEEREIIRNIYNGDWDNIPNNISTQLRTMSSNNNMGEIVKVLMITSAGSEGINLRNTRYVHIMEPYWHPVRIEQVIGRARRICSHQGLEEQYRTVEVFIYLMVFTKEQLDSDSAIELKLKDFGKMPPYLPQTSDENLFEILSRKEGLSSQLLMGIKEASVDCATHSRSNAKEGIHCLRFNKSTINDYSYKPMLNDDEIDAIAAKNIKEVDWKGEPIKYTVMDKNGKPKVTMFMLRIDNNDVYDYDSVKNKDPRLIGRLIKSDSGFIIEFNE